MKQFPELRPVLWDGIVAAAVILLAIFCAVTLWGKQEENEALTVVISVDGEEIERCALENFPDMAQFYSNNGYTLKVALASEKMAIRVEESDCPTQDCVHTGMISRGGQSIVCLPARIIIQLEGGSVSGNDPDLVIG